MTCSKARTRCSMRRSSCRAIRHTPRFERSTLRTPLEASLRAVSVASGTSGYSARPLSAPYALKIANTYLATNAQDAYGWGHYELARALAFCGRYEEAVRNAAFARTTRRDWQNDPMFSYRYAAMLSLANDVEHAASWLLHAYAHGFSNINSVRQSADWANLQRAHPDRFAAMTRVTSTWAIEYGVLMDDVFIRNTSLFALTNVTVRVRVRKGSQVWDQTFTCAAIRVGGVCKGENLFSIPETRSTKVR